MPSTLPTEEQSVGPGGLPRPQRVSRRDRAANREAGDSDLRGSGPRTGEGEVPAGRPQAVHRTPDGVSYQFIGFEGLSSLDGPIDSTPDGLSAERESGKHLYVD